MRYLVLFLVLFVSFNSTAQSKAEKKHLKSWDEAKKKLETNLADTTFGNNLLKYTSDTVFSQKYPHKQAFSYYELGRHSHTVENYYSATYY